ncbi:hypothetical protein V1525DRAFT_35698 [Lipomyces kononenkoae]|uniref:Uncharacterized protein n=1 Tax=Lipomyces kononenkoae TaxID=34357 RepID=A0ACC3T703_LIPKO
MDVYQSRAGSRPSTTTPRRQALNACDACRSRKTKCDEAKPSCGRCARLQLTCSYVETIASKKSLSLVELTSTLTRMEQKIDILVSRNPRSEGSHNANHTGNQSSTSVYPNTINADLFSTSGQSPRIPMDTYFARSNFEFPHHPGELALSERHSTAPQHLLLWPCSAVKLSKTDLNYPISLEIKRQRLPRTVGSFLPSTHDGNWLSHLSLRQLRHLAQLYFSHFHPPYLVIDETHFYNHHFITAFRDEFQHGVDSVISLLVLSLGAIAAIHTRSKDWMQAESQVDQENFALSLFNLALQVFEQAEAVDWASVQCCLLIGTFYASKLITYESWKAIHRACSTILILLPLQDVLDAHQCQLYWVTYLHESQILAEFDFPPSGLGTYANTVPLPLVPDSSQDSDREYQFFFLAHIAMRRLLNRIHFHIFSRKQENNVPAHANSTPALECEKLLYTTQSVISELDRQLEEWRECLPSTLQFPSYSMSQLPDEMEPRQFRDTRERLKGNLMARYFAAKFIIHRSFVYRALHRGPTSPLSEEEKLGAQISTNCAILAVCYSGLLHEPMELLLHPINSCRSFYALGLQAAFILRAGDPFELALPNLGQFIQGHKDRMAAHAAPFSPTVARDLEILDELFQ